MMPGEFQFYFFNQDTGNVDAFATNNHITISGQVSHVIKWVCIKNGLYNAIEHIAVKYPFAAGVGRKTGGDANSPLALDASAKGLLKKLKELPAKMYEMVGPLIKPYIEVWIKTKADTETAVLAYRGAEIDEDKAIFGDMAPEGRLELVLSLCENAYATLLRLAEGQFPLINLFDVFLDSAVRGKVGASIAPMASSK